jgi:hypothetical protein
MGITGEASQNGHRFIGAGLPLSRSNSVGILLLFFESFSFLDLISEYLNHALPANFFESVPETDEMFDVHNTEHFAEWIQRLPVFIIALVWFLFLCFFCLHSSFLVWVEQSRI